MAVLAAVGLVVLLSMAVHSDGAYCVCNTGLDEKVLQKNIDYACGNGADCSQIHQNAPCFNPNTVHDHCNYAVNSYYQKQRQLATACDFAGTATVSQTAPTASSGCVYPSSASNAGSATPTTGGMTNTGGNTGGMVPPGSSSSFGMGPTGSGFGNTDSSGVTMLSLRTPLIMLMAFSLTLLLTGFQVPKDLRS